MTEEQQGTLLHVEQHAPMASGTRRFVPAPRRFHSCPADAGRFCSFISHKPLEHRLTFETAALHTCTEYVRYSVHNYSHSEHLSFVLAALLCVSLPTAVLSQIYVCL